MRRINLMRLCLVALLATAGVAVSSASAAEPELFECAKAAKVGKETPTGEFSDKNCSVPVEGGKYKLQPGIGKAKVFQFTGKRSTHHVPAVGGEITCATVKGSGKYTSTTSLGDVVFTWRTCTNGGRRCTSAGATAGTIVTNPLEGNLGYISKSPLNVGVDFKGEGGKDIEDFTCEGLVYETGGSLIGEVGGDINKFNTAVENDFTVGGEDLQEAKKFEGGPKDVLETSINGSPPLEAGVQAALLARGENLEIKA
jgi:hypothetical protein